MAGALAVRSLLNAPLPMEFDFTSDGAGESRVGDVFRLLPCSLPFAPGRLNLQKLNVSSSPEHRLKRAQT